MLGVTTISVNSVKIGLTVSSSRNTGREKKMKKKLLFVTLIALLLFAGAFGAIAQADEGPVSSEPKPVPVLDVGMNPVAPAMAPKPAAMASKVPAPAMGAPMAVAPPKAATVVAPKAPVPEWKTGSFWVLKVVLPILLFVLTLLVTLGVVKKTWLVWLREKNAIKIADKVVSGFLSYAKSTDASWDDILSEALKAVVVRLGELTPELESKVKAVVVNRRKQEDAKDN